MEKQNHEVFLFMIIGILIMFSLALTFILFFTYSQRKIFQEKMRLQQAELEHQAQLLYHNIRTQEEERKRIAKDLHDEIGSNLNVIKLGLHQADEMAEGIPALAQAIHNVFGLIRSTIDTTRRISHDLLPPTLEDFGLAEAIKELCEAYQNTNALSLRFEYLPSPELVRIDKGVELNLFRVLQECLNNSIKHGKASEVLIQLELGKNELQLAYHDNGQGFDLEALQHKKGLGMQNIESRLKMIQANWSVDSQFGQGFHAQIKYVYP